MSEAAEELAPEAPTVWLGMPHSGSMLPETMMTLGKASLGRFNVQLSFCGSSLLAYNFNQLWADALNESPRPDYFAMCHSDIAAEAGWLDTLIDTLEAEHADMVSAVVPIKDFQGLTSTCVIDIDGDRRRRITVEEAMKLPEVFDAKLAGDLFGIARPVLCVNTGLWVCRFAGQDWVEKSHFQTGDDVRRGPDGRFRAHVFPEDWFWSAELAALGKKVVATRRVALQHFGRAPFGIGGAQKPWGTLEADGWVPC